MLWQKQVEAIHQKTELNDPKEKMLPPKSFDWFMHPERLDSWFESRRQK